MGQTLVPFDENLPAWEQAFYAFLAEKERRSGSMRTVDAYSRQLQRFFGTLGKTPEQVTPPDVFGFAHGIGPSGRKPAAITIGARLACISSFYRFLIRMKIVSTNPCDQLERPRVSPAPPKGLSAVDIRRLLAAVPDTRAGVRDRAIIITLALTGRRRAEVLNLKARDIIQTSGVVLYTYRGKGGKQGKRELPMPAFEAIRAELAAWGKDLGTMEADESIWPSPSGGGITSATFYGRLQRYLRLAGLPLSGVHVLRHAAAKLRRDAGESIEDVSHFLDHNSLAVTTVYLRRLEGQEDRGWGPVAAAIGV